MKDLYSDISTKEPLEFVREIFSSDFSEEIKERLLDLFSAAFQNLESISKYKIDRINVYLYLILKIILYTLDNRVITNRIANLYSKINYGEILKEIENEKYYNIDIICQDLNIEIIWNKNSWEFGKNIVKSQTEILKTKWKIHYTDYLKLAVKLRDEYRKLVNNPLSEGYVFIKEKRLARLLQEIVRDKILVNPAENKNALKKFREELLKIEIFKELYKDILKEWSKREEEFSFKFKIDFEEGADVSELFPPCVNEILMKATEGQNLIHYERLFIVWFLIALDYPTDYIVNIFSSLPDFNPEKTTYQVNYAKKKEYTPYKCSTLKSYNLCLAVQYKDELCLKGYHSIKHNEDRNINHPLSYIRIKQYRKSKKPKTENHKNNKNNEQ